MRFYERFSTQKQAIEFIQKMADRGIEAWIDTPGPAHEYLVGYWE